MDGGGAGAAVGDGEEDGAWESAHVREQQRGHDGRPTRISRDRTRSTPLLLSRKRNARDVFGWTFAFPLLHFSHQK